MRLLIWLLVILVGNVALAVELEKMSLKAGPSAPEDGLFASWVESFAYPKVLPAGERLNLGVRLTSKVKRVIATFDFTKDTVSLQSSDGFSWDGFCLISPEVSSGLHFVKYAIEGEKGAIQRSLEFFVEKREEVVPAPVVEEIKEDFSPWQLTVSATTTVFVNGGNRTLQKGEKITALSRTPFYKISFVDGSQAWISADNIEDPSAEYYLLGYEAYREKDFSSAVRYYKNAVILNPDLNKGYYWLAKSYYAQGNWEDSYFQLKKLLRRDERNLEGRILAVKLAPKFFTVGQKLFKDGKYSEAIQAYQKAVELKPVSAASWLQLGQAYKNLGFDAEAQSAFKEAEKYGIALLPTIPEPATGKETPILSQEDSIVIVKESLTRKGMTVEKALKSVVSLTKSLGTQIVEKGWQVEGRVVSYLCEQNDGKLEVFRWLISPDTRVAVAHNQNAKLLVERW